MKLEMFLNDNYRLLKLLYDNQTTVLNKKIVPITQAKICTELSMSKMKINAMFVELQKEGFVIQETRGKYGLSVESEKIIRTIETLR